MRKHLLSVVIFCITSIYSVKSQVLLARYDFNRTGTVFTNQSYLPSYSAPAVTFGGEFTEFCYTTAKVSKSFFSTQNADCVMFTPSGTGANTSLFNVNNRFFYVSVTPAANRRISITKAIFRYKTVIGSSTVKSVGIRLALRPDLSILSSNPFMPFTLGFPVCNTAGAWNLDLASSAFAVNQSTTYIAPALNPSLDASFTKPVNLTFEFTGAEDGSNSLYIDWIEFWGDASYATTETPVQKNFYIDPVDGNDANKGETPNDPLKDVKSISPTQLVPGSKILFKAGTTYNGTVYLYNVNGGATEPIVISSYWDGLSSQTPAATINAASFLSGIQLENCSFIHVDKLNITANGGGVYTPSIATENMRCGVLVRSTRMGNYSNITLSDLYIHDIFYQNPGFTGSISNSSPMGYGIRCINQTVDATMKDILIENCKVSNVEHVGVQIIGSGNSYIDSVRMVSSTIFHSGGPGVQMSKVRAGYFGYLTVDGSGSSDDARKWKRGSGLWTFATQNVLIEHCRFSNANGPGDSAGSHIDYNCSDVVMQYNLSINNAGGFVEILGNDWNCCYRYNVSVNDGWRIKGVNGASQEGKTLWLSGYVGSSTGVGPYFSYIYNNTIFVDSTIVSKYSFDKTASGILIANNIFHILGSSASVLGDQTSTASQMKIDGPDVFFKNNLFLKASNWPIAENIKDKAPIYGNSNFVNPGGMNIEDYIPQNTDLIKGKGIIIPRLPNDNIGLKIGLKAPFDILGNPIGESIDLGAIAVSSRTSVENVPKDEALVRSGCGNFSASYSGMANLTVYSIAGVKLFSKSFSGMVTIDIKRGVYLVKINKEVHKILVW